MTERSSRRARGVVIVLALIGIIAIVLWRRHEAPPLRADGDSDGSQSATANDPRERENAGDRASGDRRSSPDDDTHAPELPPTHTLRDPAIRDEIRRRILASWTTPAPPSAQTADDVAAQLEMPVRDGGEIDPDYIRDRIRDDFVPLASTCYESLRSRQADATGRLVVAFTIVADPRYGGIVDDVHADVGDASVGDSQFRDCITGSMETMSFLPPPHGGTVSVRYPFIFSDDEDD